MISKRALAMAFFVVVLFIWAQDKVTDTRRVPTGPIADTSILGTSTVREVAACLVFEDTLLPERYADYRHYYQGLIDGQQKPMLPFRGFAMGDGRGQTAGGERSSCKIWYPQLINDRSDPLVIAVTRFSETFDRLRDKTTEADALYTQPRHQACPAAGCRHRPRHARTEGAQSCRSNPLRGTATSGA
ncbi:hypothetical protein [Pseudomonas syringae group genomosp. 3]|uniref:hypothetical protein n=1 Tax=Pseudomonas syringae group genomosp. 3 TaxID=251701 RepID=UPI0021801286|nr:hypothetical protein [Pseudomonas syringae group genomosp. 3]